MIYRTILRMYQTSDVHFNLLTRMYSISTMFRMLVVVPLAKNRQESIYIAGFFFSNFSSTMVHLFTLCTCI